MPGHFVASELFEKAVAMFDRAAAIQTHEPKWAVLAASCLRRTGAAPQAFARFQATHAKFRTTLSVRSFLFTFYLRFFCLLHLRLCCHSLVCVVFVPLYRPLSPSSVCVHTAGLKALVALSNQLGKGELAIQYANALRKAELAPCPRPLRRRRPQLAVVD